MDTLKRLLATLLINAVAFSAIFCAYRAIFAVSGIFDWLAVLIIPCAAAMVMPRLPWTARAATIPFGIALNCFLAFFLAGTVFGLYL